MEIKRVELFTWIQNLKKEDQEIRNIRKGYQMSFTDLSFETLHTNKPQLRLFASFLSVTEIIAL